MKKKENTIMIFYDDSRLLNFLKEILSEPKEWNRSTMTSELIMHFDDVKDWGEVKKCIYDWLKITIEE